MIYSYHYANSILTQKKLFLLVSIKLSAFSNNDDGGSESGCTFSRRNVEYIIGVKIYPKLPPEFQVGNTRNVVSFLHQNLKAMDSKDIGNTTQLRRKLAKLKHHDLKGLDYIRSQIFTACETIDCGSYVCNLSTGHIEEQYGLTQLLLGSNNSRSVQEIEAFTHPSDRKKIHEILEGLYELGKEKFITGRDRLSCVYRIKLQNRYIQIYRQSGLAIKESKGELINWSNIYAMPTLAPLDYVRFNWSGTNFGQTELLNLLNKNSARIFTSKEMSIISALKNGLSTTEVTASLHITTQTLQKHLSNMFQKTGTKSRLQLLKYLDRINKS